MRARFWHAMATGVGSAADSFTGVTRLGMRFIVAAASSGTIIEWYDFYIFVTLGFILTPLFFKLTTDPAVNFLAFLATYASGFAVRPFGAIVFGRIGDLVGRKYAFLLTVTIMGLGTAAIAFIPVYDQIGLLAPIALMFLRCLQGLALGGEYGGAAIYVAEHAPDERRGYWTRHIHSLGLANPLPPLARPRGHFRVHPIEAAGNAPLHPAQGERPKFREAAQGGPCEPGQLEADSPRPVRRDRGTSGRMVHRSVPCAVLHAADPEGGPVHVERDHVRCPGARDTPLHRVRPPFRPNRTEENHDGRMPPGRRELCAPVRGDGGFWKAPQRAGHDRPGVRPSGMGHHGLRTHRRVLGRVLPGSDPIHVSVPSLSPRER